MTKPSLHAQAAAIDVAVRYAGRSGESDMLVRGLKAARHKRSCGFSPGATACRQRPLACPPRGSSISSGKSTL